MDNDGGKSADVRKKEPDGAYKERERNGQRAEGERGKGERGKGERG